MGDFSRHPDLDRISKRTAFLRDSYLGGIDYKKKDYLPSYGREEDEDYNRRLESATYTNLCAPIIEIYNNYVFSGKIERDGFKGLSGAEFDAFLEDADMMGRSYVKMVREISKQAGAYGFLGLIIDKPRGEAASKGEELEKGIRPYIAVYVPGSIITYELEYTNGSRQLTRLVLLEETGDPDKVAYKVWYRDRWELWERKATERDEDLVMVDIDANPLGRIPFISVINRDKEFHPIIGKSDIADIADINNRLYGFDSDAQHIIKQCAFPFLQGPKSTIRSIDKIGTTTALEIDDSDGETKPELKWTEPVHTSLPQIMAWRHEAISDIKEMSKLNSGQADKAQIGSGVALEIQFRPLNAMLTEKAENMELAETRILTIVGLWLGQTFAGKVSYPREFSVMDIMAEIDIAISAKAAVQSRAFKAAIEKSIASKALAKEDEALLKQVYAEIDAGENELQEPPAEEE